MILITSSKRNLIRHLLLCLIYIRLSNSWSCFNTPIKINYYTLFSYIRYEYYFEDIKRVLFSMHMAENKSSEWFIFIYLWQFEFLVYSHASSSDPLETGESLSRKLFSILKMSRPQIKRCNLLYQPEIYCISIFSFRFYNCNTLHLCRKISWMWLPSENNIFLVNSHELFLPDNIFLNRWMKKISTFRIYFRMYITQRIKLKICITSCQRPTWNTFNVSNLRNAFSSI